MVLKPMLYDLGSKAHNGRPIMAKQNSYWPSKFHNGLVNPGVNVKPKSQLINKLMVACSGIALVLTLGSHIPNGPRPKACLPSGQYHFHTTTGNH